MRVCDICGDQSELNTFAHTSYSEYKNIDLCERCYNKFIDNKCEHGYLAYKETVEEITKKNLDEEPDFNWFQKWLLNIFF